MTDDFIDNYDKDNKVAASTSESCGDWLQTGRGWGVGGLGLRGDYTN